MTETTRFVITAEHLMLARRMYVGWDEGEFGAPAIDCKRPYGNSDVYADIAEIVGIPTPDIDEGEEFSYLAIKRMDSLHKQMATVIQIGLVVGKFQTGNYVCEKYKCNWKMETT